MLFVLNSRNDIPWMLIEMREHAGLTQRQAANLMDIRQSTLSAWELGRNRISLEKFISMAKVYDSEIMIRGFLDES